MLALRVWIVSAAKRDTSGDVAGRASRAAAADAWQHAATPESAVRGAIESVVGGYLLRTVGSSDVRLFSMFDDVFPRTSKNSWAKLIGASHWPKLWMLHVTILRHAGCWI